MTKIKQEHERMVDMTEQDGDRYWIYLRSGYGLNMGEHCICEDTWAKAVAKLDDVKECHCAECRAFRGTFQ